MTGTNGVARQNGAYQAIPMRHSSRGDLGHNQVVQATEGWLELFLSPPEKYAFSRWNEVVRDKSLVHDFTRTLFESWARFIPVEIAPNLLTLTGFIGLGQAWYLSYTYGSLYPTATTWIATLAISFFFVAASLYIPHADRTRQHTPLSDLFKYACDSASTVWLAMLTVASLGGAEYLEVQWFAVQSGQLILFLKHLSAFRRASGLRYHLGAGPGEVLLTCVALLACRAAFGLDALRGVVEHVVGFILPDHAYDHAVSGELIRLLYYGLFVSALAHSALISRTGNWTRFGLLVSLSTRFIPAVLLFVGVQPFQLSATDVICDGLFMTVLTTDVVLAKMSKRGLHPWVVVMSLAAVLSHSIVLTLVTVYFIAVFSDLCFYLNLPLLTTCRNVYCDGVYDLCHIGHKRAFQKALSLGNRLFVGVVGDEDASNYKRPPIMTAAERCAEVDACKAVTKVIPNAPCFGLTREFLEEHQIHIVAFGQEYLERYPDPKDDPYYRYPRELGIACPLPRSPELSTSELISRIKDATVEKKSPT